MTRSGGGLHWGRLFLALAYFAICALGHLQFTDWLIAQRRTLGHDYAYADALVWLLPALAALLLLWVLWQAARMQRLGIMLSLWGVWALSIFLWDRWLTYSVPEYLHHPQYAILALLLAWAMDSDRQRLAIGRVLFWTTLLGMVDEGMQYLWITTSYSNYLDFNDFLTNLLGAMAGVLLYYGRPLPDDSPAMHAPRKRQPAHLEWGLALALAGLVVLGLASGRMVVTPQEPVPAGGIARIDAGHHVFYLQRTVPASYNTWEKGNHRPRYWILGPGTGMGLLLGTGFAFASLAHLGLRRRQDPV